MRKRLIPKLLQDNQSETADWLELEHLVEVEMTSEDVKYPIEAALLSGESSGWRAAAPGTQTLRLLFPVAQSLRKIQLIFKEDEAARTQQYTLRWSPDNGRSFREIIRQQWNFSPAGSTIETEELDVQLEDVTLIELVIVPDINNPQAVASLAKLRLA